MAHHKTFRIDSLVMFAACAALLVACGTKARSVDTVGSTSTSRESATSGFVRVGETKGFDEPESAVYDSTMDVWFVSNIVGDALTKDHNGFISRLKGDGTLDSLHFIRSGSGPAVLDGPKGLALHGDTIWVADIDAARAFNKRTGALLTAVDFAPLHAMMLNAIAIGPDGRVYITDTGLHASGGGVQHVGPDRIFVIGPGLTPQVAVTDSAMEGPNGISWDATHRRFLVVGYTGRAITSWAPGDPSVKRVAAGVGQFDGNAMLSDGRALVTSWADSSLYVLSGDSLERVIAEVLPSPADLHVDTRRMRAAIPLVSENTLVFFSLPKAP